MDLLQAPYAQSRKEAIVPINQPEIPEPKRAYNVPRGQRIAIYPPLPYRQAWDDLKSEHEQKHGQKITEIDMFFILASETDTGRRYRNRLHTLHEHHLKDYKGVKYGTNIDGIKTARTRTPSDADVANAAREA